MTWLAALLLLPGTAPIGPPGAAPAPVSAASGAGAPAGSSGVLAPSGAGVAPATSVPSLFRGYLYYARLEPGRPEPVLCRRRDAAGAPEEPLLDPNGKAPADRFSVLQWQPSDDGRLLAYLAQPAAGGPPELRVRDLTSGASLPDAVASVGSFAWAADGRTLFYALLDAGGRGRKVNRHRLGDAPGHAAPVYEERDRTFAVSVRRTRSGAFVLIDLQGIETSEVRAIPASHPRQEPALVLERKAGRRATAEHRNEFFLLRLDDQGPGFRLVASPTGDPAPRRWVEVIAHRPGVVIEEVIALRRFAVVRTREGGRTRFSLLDPRTGEPSDLGDLGVPEAAWSLLPARNDDYEALAFRYAARGTDGAVTVHEWDARTRAYRAVGREPPWSAPR